MEVFEAGCCICWLNTILCCDPTATCCCEPTAICCCCCCILLLMMGVGGYMYTTVSGDIESGKFDKFAEK